MMALPSPEEIREKARELVARQGLGALTYAEWEVIAHEENGRLDEARLWRMIAGTVLGMIDE
jgi:hypothetical protein